MRIDSLKNLVVIFSMFLCFIGFVFLTFSLSFSFHLISIGLFGATLSIFLLNFLLAIIISIFVSINFYILLPYLDNIKDNRMEHLAIKTLVKKARNDFSDVYNELDDDLKLDLKRGEYGYKSYKESHEAIKEHTLKKIDELYDKWCEIDEDINYE